MTLSVDILPVAPHVEVLLLINRHWKYMQTFELILLILAAVLASSVVDQLLSHISLPLVQIGLGVVITILAWSPVDVTLDPEFFLVLFIAPLLFNDTKEVDKLGLWENRQTILALAIGLVVIIVLAVGYSVHWLIPSIPLSAAFALGAALGPTDAVAVSSLSSETELGRRENALLSGESLLNDATGVVSFQFAIAAAVTGAFSIVDATVDFVISFFGGIAIGIILGLVLHALQNKIRDLGLESITFHVLFDVFLPFIIYLFAEICNVSGILAVVAAGIVISNFSERRIGPSAARLNIVSSSVWRVLTFALNGMVFVMLGMQLPRAMQSTWDSVQIHNLVLIGYVLLITAILVVVRFLYILFITRIHKDKKTGKRHHIDKTARKSILISTVGGPKGAVTLSVIFSIPLLTDAGASFPQRDLIIFLASGVILCTLLLANFALPALAPAPVKDATKDEQEVAHLKVEIMHKIIERLTASIDNENARATNAVISSYNDRIDRIRDEADIENEDVTQLRIQVSREQQSHIAYLIEKGSVDETEGYKYIRHLSQAQSFLLHKGSSQWMVKHAFRNVKRTLRVFKNLARSMKPGEHETKYSTAYLDVQMKASMHAIEYLRGLMDNPDCPYRRDTLNAMLLNYTRALRTVQSTLPSITTYAQTSDRRADIERKALNWELEEIQELYDAGKLSHAQAKNMRDNVYLMQADLEEQV